MFKNKTFIIFIFSLITTIASIVICIFFVIVIKNKNYHTSAVLTTLENKILKKQNISTVIKKISETEETRKSIESYFVNTSEIDSFVGYLENIGTLTNTDLKVGSVVPSTVTKNTLNISVSSEGDFPNVFRTLKLLENSPYNIQIQQVFLNQRLQTSTEEVKGVIKTKETSLWHIDISFSVLTSS